MRKSDKPYIKDAMLFDADPQYSMSLPILVGSKIWFAWLVKKDSFIYEGSLGHFSARRELRRGISYWYAYRRLEGKLSKVYLGRSEELTLEHLEKTSAVLAGQVPLQRLVNQGHSSNLISSSTLQASLLKTVLKSNREIPKPPLTKITPPALPTKLTTRTHLIKRFNTPVTILHAPGGYGTTTVINEWQKKCGMPVAWVSLDAGENDPLRFWSAVVTALQTINPALGEDWFSQLRSSTSASFSTIVVNLTNDIIRTPDSGESLNWIGLVLDNYHLIRNPEIHTSLQTLLEHLPPSMKLVIGSHTIPPLSLGYLRAKGMVTELDIDDLRFTLEEGIEYLIQNMPEPFLAYSQMQTLIKRTEGWITGLVFAVSFLTQQWDRSLFLGSFTGKHPLLQEFFTENVLNLQPLEIQNFLLRISILKKITGPLCDLLTDRNDSTEILRRFCEKNLYLTHMQQSGWYRFTNMFSDVLLEQLREAFPEEIQLLHKKAALWYQSQEMRAEAIEHFLIGESWEEAAQLIENVVFFELKTYGEDSRLLAWLSKLPINVMRNHKVLFAVYIRLASIVFHVSEVSNLLDNTENDLSTVDHADQVEIIEEIHQFRKILAGEEQGNSIILKGEEIASVCWMLDGLLQVYRLMRDDLIEAERKANEIFEYAQKKKYLYAILMAGGTLASLSLTQGRLRQGEQIAQQVLRQAFAISGKFPELASISLIALSEVFFLRNQIPQAHQFLVRAAEVNPDPTSTIEIVSIAILRAKIQSALGDHEAAFSTIQAARELHGLRPSSIWLDQDMIAYLELFLLRKGELDTTKLLPMDRGDIHKSPFSALIHAEVHIEHQRSIAAEEIINNLLNKYPHGAYKLTLLRIKVVLSIALFEQRKLKEASKVLVDASRMAAPEFCIRPFLDYGPKIVSLVSLIVRTEHLNPGVQSFLKGLLATLEKTDGMQKPLSRDESANLAIAASISPREQQILQLICAGLSNREIAEKFSISNSTVKTHLENIFRKLEVNSRTQAIAQAQALGLVPN